jgi:hypothetical protein
MPFVRLKRRVQDGVKVWHFEASLILQVVFWCLCYPVSYP